MTASASRFMSFLAQEGSLGPLYAGRDWQSTCLPAPEQWPLALQTLVRTMLGSRMPMLVMWGDRLGCLYNAAYVPYLGERHPSALGEPFTDIRADIWPQVAGLVDATLRGGSPYFENLPFVIHRHGREDKVWVTGSYSPAYDDEGNIAGVFCVIADTTAQMVAEQRQALQLRLADSLRELSEPTDIMRAASRLTGEHFGVSRVGYAEIDEKRQAAYVHEDWGDWHDTVSTSLAGQARPLECFGPALIDELRRGRTLCIEDVLRDERARQHAEGYASIGARSVVVVPFLEDGRLGGAFHVHSATPRCWNPEDVTLVEDIARRTWDAMRRARTEQALRSSELRLRRLFDANPIGVVRGDTSGHILDANAAFLRLIGRSPEDLRNGRIRWDELTPPEHFALDLQAIHEVEEHGVSRVYEKEYLLSDGRRIPVLVACAAFGEGGELVAFVVDISDRKKAEQALQETNRRKDEFLAMLAHELRNPLAPISVAAHILKMAPADEQRVKHSSDIISRQVDHMTELVDDLLDVSRVTRGLVELQLENVGIRSVVASAVEQVRPLVDRKRHALELRLGESDTAVRGDRTRLVQVLVNLLNNAAKYTLDGGRIALEVTADDAEVAISVSDDGCGIDASLLPHVFELFTQAKRTPDRAQGGLGLGLALVKSIMELHGGSVTARSEGAGKGSTFCLRLPRLQAGRAAELASAPEQRQKAYPGARRIMIVDDNVDAGQTLAALLQAHGHQVTVCDDAAGSLDIAGRESPEVFILDIGLPGMDGYELVRRLRRERGNNGAAYIALTGYGRTEDHAQSESAGFSHHLVKPVDIRRLLDILATLPLPPG